MGGVRRLQEAGLVRRVGGTPLCNAQRVWTTSSMLSAAKNMARACSLAIASESHMIYYNRIQVILTASRKAQNSNSAALLAPAAGVAARASRHVAWASAQWSSRARASVMGAS